MSELLPCPCGKVPTKLNIQDGDTYRWRVISGDCCGDWSIESSRIDISATPKQIDQQCIEDWNEASRSSETARLREQLKVAVGALRNLCSHGTRDSRTIDRHWDEARAFLAEIGDDV